MTVPVSGGTADTAATPPASAAAGLADQVAAAVVGCPGVAGLVSGPIATYLAGRTVAGVALREREIEVAISAIYGTPLHPLADRVRAAVWRFAPGYRVDVLVEDVAAGPPAAAVPPRPPGTGPASRAGPSGQRSGGGRRRPRR